MHEIKWSPSEKKIARRAFEDALDRALAKIIAAFKAKAAAAVTPSDMWDIEDYLRRPRREIDKIFDYRYSQLLLVFARLIHEGFWTKPISVACRRRRWKSFAASVADDRG